MSFLDIMRSLCEQKYINNNQIRNWKLTAIDKNSPENPH